MWLSSCRVLIWEQLETLISACLWDYAPSLFQENFFLKCVWLRLSCLAFTQEAIKKITRKIQRFLTQLRRLEIILQWLPTYLNLCCGSPLIPVLTSFLNQRFVFNGRSDLILFLQTVPASWFQPVLSCNQSVFSIVKLWVLFATCLVNSLKYIQHLGLLSSKHYSL